MIIGKKQLLSMQPYAIAIDGPAGAGKSTIAQEIAKKYKILYLSTGQLYRSLTFALLQNGIDINNSKEILDNINKLKLGYSVATSADEIYLKITLNGQEIDKRNLYCATVTGLTPTVAKIPQVREHFRQIQRDIASKNSLVMEGRDICSVVLPNAKYKFFITASQEERAARRLAQTKGDEGDYLRILEEIKTRDYIDEHRVSSPLKKADDAELIDTTNLSIADSVAAIEDSIFRRRFRELRQNPLYRYEICLNYKI